MQSILKQLDMKCSKCEKLNHKCFSCDKEEYKSHYPSLMVCNNCGQFGHLYCTYKAPEQIYEEKEIERDNAFKRP